MHVALVHKLMSDPSLYDIVTVDGTAELGHLSEHMIPGAEFDMQQEADQLTYKASR
jgi:hypothetical protein